MTTFDSHAKKRVSYIIPTRNRADHLSSALLRCRDLKGPNDELLVIDGASSDQTKDVVRKYSDIVDVFVSEPDLDGCHAQNKGLLLATGKYTRLLADDDITHKEGLEKAIDVMEKHPEIDLLLCGGIKEDTKGKKFTSYLPLGTNFGSNTEDVFKYPAIASGCGHIVRRKSIAKFGLFPFSVYADNAFVLDFIQKGAVVRFCRINLYYHALFPHSVSVRVGKKGLLFLAKKYCSATFFVKFFIKTKWKNSPLFRPLREFLSAVRRHIYKAHKHIFNISGKLKQEYLWDGKLS